MHGSGFRFEGLGFRVSGFLVGFDFHGNLDLGQDLGLYIQRVTCRVVVQTRWSRA